MTDKLRELTERWKTRYTAFDVPIDVDRHNVSRRCADELLSILDAEGDGDEVVGVLNVRRYRGSDSMVNHDFDYYGNLKDGAYNLYTHSQPVRSGVVSDEQVRQNFEDWYRQSGIENGDTSAKVSARTAYVAAWKAAIQSQGESNV